MNRTGSYRLRLPITWPYQLLYASLIALATGYAAQVRIPLPGTPVPITLQTFVVVLSGVLLGRWWGALSQLLYVGVGVVGAPLFSGMQGGLWVLFGPRGGYLLGFVVTSFLLGHVVGNIASQCAASQCARKKNFTKMFFVVSGLYFPVMYGLGCLQLGLWLTFVKGSFPGVYQLLLMGVIPFVPGDLLKVAGAAMVMVYSWGCEK